MFIYYIYTCKDESLSVFFFFFGEILCDYWFLTGFSYLSARNHLSNNLFFLYISGKRYFFISISFVIEAMLFFLSWLLNVYCWLMMPSGKLVEEEEGNLALWLSYILTGAGANLVSWLVLPRNIVSVGASGAVFGLFVISVLVKVIQFL